MIARERAVGEVPEILLEVNLEGIRIYDFEGGRGGGGWSHVGNSNMAVNKNVARVSNVTLRVKA